MTKIQWTEETWNPIGGCRKISDGCRNCYAIRQAHRLAGNPNKKIAERYEGLTQITNGSPNWTGATFIDGDVLAAPLWRKKPTRYFISLSDLFFDGRPDSQIAIVIDTIRKAHWHTFMVLTKYHERMLSYFRDHWHPSLPDNLWLGVSAENHDRMRERTNALRLVSAAVLFVSYEPALGPVEWGDLLHGINWLIVGGESGPGARPCNVEWIRSTVRQCKAADVACFVKQLGQHPVEWRSNHRDYRQIKLLDRKGGDMAEWPADLRVREYPR